MTEVVGAVDASTVRVSGTVRRTSASFSGSTGGGGSGGGADHTVAVFTDDFDPTGSFTTVPLHNGATIPRAYLSGATVLIVDGDHLGLWTIPASGAATAGTALAPADVIAAMNGLLGTASATDGVTVDRVVVQATEDYADAPIAGLSEAISALEAADTSLDGRLDAVETAATATDAAVTRNTAGIAQAEDRIRAEAIAHIDLNPAMQVGVPGGEDDFALGAYSATPPADFTTGFGIRFIVTALDVTGYGTPDDGFSVFTSPFAWNALPDVDGFYIVRAGIQRVWDATAAAWRLHVFCEITQEGDTESTIIMSTAGQNSEFPPWEMALGAPTEIAINFLCENGDGVWDLRFLARTHFGDPDTTLDAGEFVTIARALGDGPATIATSTEPWLVGLGHGKLRLPIVEIRDEGLEGPILASPTGAAAAQAGEGQAFDDAQSVTWTPGAQALVHWPRFQTVSMDGGYIGSHIAAVRVTDNGSFTLPTLTEADHGRQLWLYVLSPGATIDSVFVPGSGMVADYELTDDHLVLVTFYGYGEPYWELALDTPIVGGTGGGGLDETAVQALIDASTAGLVTTGDSRLTDTRTPTDDSVTVAKLAAATLARIGTTVEATSDSTARTSTTYTADGTLQFEGAADTTYRIDAYLIFQGDATADLKVGFTTPAGTMHLTVEGALTTVASASDYDRFLTLTSSGATTVVGIAGASTPISVRISGVIHLTSAGTVSFGWAPNGAGAGTGVTRLARSQLYYRAA